MLAPFVRMLRERAESRDPKAYKILFSSQYTKVGRAEGEGWYILAPGARHFGPIRSQEAAEDIVFAAIEEMSGKTIGTEQRQKARALWAKYQS